MSLYERYEQLLGLPYIEGKQDCYGLVRNYYRMNYGLELGNYARPGDFAHANLDLISDNFFNEGFKIVEVPLSNLDIGDGLLMQINGSPLVNHVAVYVGNNMILHHLYQGMSKEDDYSLRWKSRTVTVVRHPEISEANWKGLGTLDFMQVLKDDDALPPQIAGAE